MMEDSSSDDDFVHLPGPSTCQRVKRKNLPDADDHGGPSTSKVGGGSGRGVTEQRTLSMTKEDKKKEAARIRQQKSRAKKTEAMLEKERKKARVRMAICRDKKTEAEKTEDRKKAQIGMEKLRHKKSEEEKVESKSKIAIHQVKKSEDEMRKIKVNEQQIKS